MESHIYQENQGFEVISTNISLQKGTIKTPQPSIHLNIEGVSGDAHAGKWHRQISLLGIESFIKFEKNTNRKTNFGEFAENITTKGFELYSSQPFDRFVCDAIVMEVTQIGKKCHGATCAIYNETGDCVMPKEGIFCRVINGGDVKNGMFFQYYRRHFRVKIITLSDRVSSGEYEDISGTVIQKRTEEYFNSQKRLFSVDRVVIPDDINQLQFHINESIDNQFDIIFTTGGTGVGPRDITPETVKPFIQKEIPGIMEMIRTKYGLSKPNALLSRGIAGLSEKSFIYTLPGSVKAVNEYMEEIFKTQEHLFLMLNSIDSH